MWAQLQSFTVIDWVLALVDITLVSYFFYRFFLIIRRTRAVQLINGLAVFFIVLFLSSRLELGATHYLLQQITFFLAVAIPVVFQPELRRALEHLGRGPLFRRSFFYGEEDSGLLMGELLDAVERMARSKIGALIVLERQTGLEDIVETGIKIDGIVSTELLVNIFIQETPLHDGAVIVRNNRVIAAACFLPLSESGSLEAEMGGRHRAGLGISEQTDALAVIVSEETGAISLANAGKLIRNLDLDTLEEMLEALLKPDRREGPQSRSSPWSSP